MSFFDLFFLKKKEEKTEGERSQETEKKKKTLSFFLRHLSLSTNSIDRISGLYGLSKLQILSLGRNLLRSLAGVEVVAGSLEELWVSYNSLDKLVSFFLLFPFLLFHSLSLFLLTTSEKLPIISFFRPERRSSQGSGSSSPPTTK